MFSYLADKYRVILKNDTDYIHASYIDVRIPIHLFVYLLIHPFIFSLGLQTT